jgi:acetyltransferase-like isoleucine patch superfamily enzyme
VHETGSIRIGADCMISGGVTINNSDAHTIFDLETGNRVNHARDVVIGDRVWLAERVMVGKGTRIGSGSVIGAASFASGMIPENVVAAGVPARILRRNVGWKRPVD